MHTMGQARNPVHSFIVSITGDLHIVTAHNNCMMNPCNATLRKQSIC